MKITGSTMESIANLSRFNLNAMSVLAIDMGNYNIVAAVPKDRGIDIIQSDTSKRQIPTIVSY